MHTSSTRQSGFGHVVTMIIVVLVFSAIGLIGYKLYANPLNSKGSEQSIGKRADPRTTTAELNVPAAPEIKSASDLDKAQSVLDQVDPGSSSQSDSSQLDSQLNSF